MQLWNWTASKTNSTGRLLLMAGLAGVLVAALALPVVAATGILIRNTADKFTATAVNTSGLPQRSAIYDASGHLITYVYGVDLGTDTVYNGFDRQPVSFDQISKAEQVAIVAIEDDRFWSHGALDIKGTVRALVNDLQGKAVQGGSTLEQQYVKDVLVLQAQERGDKNASAQAIEDTLSRKLDQLREAVEVADTLTKPQILAGYLNDAYFGNGAYGIEAAAETYFDTTAAKLNLVQAATLSGIVENPTEYDPYNNPTESLERRNTVLAQINITDPTALGAGDAHRFEAEKLGLHNGAKQSGCSVSNVGQDGFFCDYVMHTLMLDSSLGATTQDRAKLLSTGGLSIYTTLNDKDQSAATKAVNYVLPKPSGYYNPANNAATEVLIQPGTGKVLALTEDRKYGTGSGETEIDYAVDSRYGGGTGVQTGSSSKLFTLITALNQGVDFGYQQTVSSPDTVTGYTNCQGQGAGSFPVSNSEGPGTSTYSLYTGTTDSINVFYAHLEQKVGLCATVKTAAALGVHRADGTSLFDYSADKSQDPADDDPSFTLGVENVSPLTMAAAYAVPASGGTYCAPIALTEIETDTGQKLGVPSAGCHTVINQRVAEAVNYILQGVLTQSGATGALLGGINGGYEAAAKTGTSNIASGNGTPYAAFAGYTTSLVGYVSVFNPKSPTTLTMTNNSACYRLEYDGRRCPEEMFGADAPGSVWHMTFDHASLSGSHDFTPVPAGSALNDAGNGQVVKQPAKPKKTKPTKGGGNGKGNGFLPISTTTTAAKQG